MVMTREPLHEGVLLRRIPEMSVLDEASTGYRLVALPIDRR